MPNDMSTQGSLVEFFSQYTDKEFNYNPTNASTSEFYRLCDHFDWDREDKERELAHSQFKDALTQQFNANYGTDSEDLAAWQKLCTRLHIQPVPNSLKRCRQVVMDTHVNLVDLVDNFEKPDKITTHFNSVKALSEYTIKTGKYFPRDNAYAGDLLKHLLRQILNPPSESEQRRPSRGGKRRVSKSLGSEQQGPRKKRGGASGQGRIHRVGS